MDAEPSTGGMTTSLAAAPTAFSITVEGDLLADSDSAPATAEPLTDWRLVVAPALVLQNLLPIRGTFLVWERPQVQSMPNAHPSCAFDIPPKKPQ